MGGLLTDIRYALRFVSRSPTFALVAVLTLALGIGANTAIFSIVSSVLLEPLPYPASDKLCVLFESSPQRGVDEDDVTAADFLDWRAQSRSFSGMAGVAFRAFSHAESGGVLRLEGLRVSLDYFKVMGVSPILGRAFVPADDRPGSDNVVAVTESFWRASLASDPAVVGKSIRLDGRPFTILAVFPDSAVPLGSTNIKVLKPMGWSDAEQQDRSLRDLYVIARLRDGVSLNQAQADLRSISQQLSRQYPRTNSDWSAELVPYVKMVLGDARRQLLVLISIAALVLVIACVNVASLSSSRLTARQREIAVRLAVGVSPARLVRQLLAESVLLGFAGGVCALLCLTWTLSLIRKVIPLPFPRSEVAHMDVRTVGFTVLLSIAAGFVFGAIPAIRATRIDIRPMLQASIRGSSGGRGQRRFLDTLVLAQIGLSFVLLIGAGLLLRTLTALRSVNPGFEPDHVLVNAWLVLPKDRYDSPAKRIAFFTTLLDRVRTLPGVRSAGGITGLPLDYTSTTVAYRVAGDDRTERGGILDTVTDGYFETVRIPLLRGRFFKDTDNELGPKAVIVNQALADRDFLNRDPIGEHLLIAGEKSPSEIVGVVGNTHQFSLQMPPKPEIFTPLKQSDRYYLYVLVRTEGDPLNLATPIRGIVASIDPDQPVSFRTLTEQLDDAVSQPRILARTVSLFGGLAVALALIGIYGVTSYGVAQRTKEFGIRSALGASPRRILRDVLLHTARVALAGVAIGSAAALVFTRFLEQFLFGVSPYDASTFLCSAAAIIVVAVLAAYIPARQAARTTPLIALREE